MNSKASHALLRPALALLALLASACGPRYALRVPNDVVKNLPFETRIELLEAENELAIAIDRRDEAANEILRARDHLRRAKDRLDAAEDEVDNAEDAVSEEIAALALAEAEARVTWLRAQQEVNVRKLDIEELSLRCAVARYEQSRLEAARKTKVEGSEHLDPKAFEEQVKSCDDEVAELRAELKADEQAEADAAKAAWDKEKSALAKKTFDARASPYVE
jgi:hypothetical protein